MNACECTVGLGIYVRIVLKSHLVETTLTLPVFSFCCIATNRMILVLVPEYHRFFAVRVVDSWFCVLFLFVVREMERFVFSLSG